MTWTNENRITQKEIDEKEGFVYEIIDKETKKVYIGIKKFKKRIRRKPLKGQKRVRIDYVESDWRKYNSSNKEWKELITKEPERFTKNIIKVCDTTTELKVTEAYMQLDWYINKDWSLLHNEMINLRLRIRKEE